MIEFRKIMCKAAKIEQDTQSILCPGCNKSNFTVFKKESIDEEFLHHAKCEECGQLFVFKVNPKGEIFVD